ISDFFMNIIVQDTSSSFIVNSDLTHLMSLNVIDEKVCKSFICACVVYIYVHKARKSEREREKVKVHTRACQPATASDNARCEIKPTGTYTLTDRGTTNRSPNAAREWQIKFI
ncbi:Protein of unknown function, partial [Cotesia congregata]